MALPATAAPTKVLPAAADSIGPVDPASAWANSSYQEYTTGLGAAIALVGYNAIDHSLSAAEGEFDIAKGASGSEVVVSTLRFGGYDGVIGDHKGLPLYPLVSNIPASTRISVRVRLRQAFGGTMRLVLLYAEDPGVPVTTNPHKSLPSASNAPDATPHASAWVNGSWVELDASGPSGDALLTGIHWGSTAAAQAEVDIGTGASGSEVVRATFRKQRHYFNAPTYDGFIPARSPMAVLPGSTRVAIRIRASASGTHRVGLNYMLRSGLTEEAPDSIESSVQKTLPSAADGISVTPNSLAWVSSGWSELSAGLGAAIIILGICVNPGDTSGLEFEVDIGKGASGSETVVTTFRGLACKQGSANVQTFNSPSPIPIDNVATSTRIAVRMRKQGTSTTAWTVTLLYLEKPVS